MTTLKQVIGRLRSLTLLQSGNSCAGLIIIGLLIAVWCRDAQAALIICEPDDFAVGATLTSACPGTTLSVEVAVGESVTATSFSNFAFPAPGIVVFGHSGTAPWEVGSGVTESVFRADFDTPTDLVRLLFLSNDGTGGGGDSGFLRAFDSSGVEIPGTEQLTGPFGPGSTTVLLEIMRPVADIAFIRASGDGLNQSVLLDTLQFNGPMTTSIPEPAGLALFLCGLLGLAALHSRWRRTS